MTKKDEEKKYERKMELFCKKGNAQRRGPGRYFSNCGFMYYRTFAVRGNEGQPEYFYSEYRYGDGDKV